MAMDPISAGIDLVNTVVDKVWPDAGAEDKAKAAQALAAMQGQLNINQTEAANSSVFVAGWRPAIGWICGASLGYVYLVYPLLQWAAAMWAPHLTPPVLVNDGNLLELLMGMLGMGGLRTYEKLKGVASK